jgi:putative ABC transport system substrate-binding protein
MYLFFDIKTIFIEKRGIILKKKSLSILLIFTIILVPLLFACSKSESTDDNSGNSDEKLLVGVTQIVSHPSLDATYEGFKKALEENGFKEGENIEFDLQIAEGDMSNSQTIASNLVSESPDLIYAISTPSAQHALAASTDIPIIFAAVSDPVGAELVESFDKPGENITGVCDTHPDAIKTTLSFITDEIGAKKLGVIYNTGEQNSIVQVEEVKELIEESGGELVEASVSTSADVKQAAESLIGRVDAIYMPTDNTVASALETLVTISNDNDIPLFAGDLDSMKTGAVAASGFDYQSIGYKAGEMAAKVLSDEQKTSDIEIAYPDEVTLTINKVAAKEQGVEIKDNWADIADFYEGE